MKSAVSVSDSEKGVVLEICLGSGGVGGLWLVVSEDGIQGFLRLHSYH